MELGEEEGKKGRKEWKVIYTSSVFNSNPSGNREDSWLWRKYKECLLPPRSICHYLYSWVMQEASASYRGALEAPHSSRDWCNSGFFFQFLVSQLLISPEVSSFPPDFWFLCNPPLLLPCGLSLPVLLADGKFILMLYSFRCNIYHSMFYFCDCVLVSLDRTFLFISTEFRNMVTRFLSRQHFILPHMYIYVAYLFRSYCTFWVKSMLSSIKSCTWHLENGAFAFLAFSLLFHFWTPSIA